MLFSLEVITCARRWSGSPGMKSMRLNLIQFLTSGTAGIFKCSIIGDSEMGNVSKMYQIHQVIHCMLEKKIEKADTVSSGKGNFSDEAKKRT